MSLRMFPKRIGILTGVTAFLSSMAVLAATPAFATNSDGDTKVLVGVADTSGFAGTPSLLTNDDGCSSGSPRYSITFPSADLPASGHFRAVTVSIWVGAPNSVSSSWSNGGTAGATLNANSSAITFGGGTGCTGTVDDQRIDVCMANSIDVSLTPPGPVGGCMSGAFLAFHYGRAVQQAAPSTCSLSGSIASYTSGSLAVRLQIPGGTNPPAGGWRIDNPALVPDINGNVIYPSTPIMTMAATDQVPGSTAYFKSASIGSMSGTQITVSALDNTGAATCWVQVSFSTSNAVTSTSNPTGDGGQTDCSVSWNILHDVECGLKWGFVPTTSLQQWSALESSAESKPPFSIMIAAKTLTDATRLQAQNNPGCAAQGVHAEDCATAFSGPDDAHTQVDFLQSAANLMDTTVVGGDIYLAEECALWIGFIYTVWNWLSRSIGAKGGEGDLGVDGAP